MSGVAKAEATPVEGKLLAGQGTVEVPAEHVLMSKRVGQKRKASGRDARWCPLDQQGECPYGVEKCAYAHVAKEAAPDGPPSEGLMTEYRIVLVDPQDSRNVGSVARLAANYGIDDVWIVSTRQLNWDEKRAKRCKQSKEKGSERAVVPENADAGDAHMFSAAFWRYGEMLATPEGLPLLHGFHVTAGLQEALVGVDKAIAFTGKRGSTFRTSTLDVPGIATLLRNPASGVKRAALVFGNEATGLSSNDTLLCSQICTLPTSAYCTSLNLSHSVCVVVSRLWELKHGTEAPTQGHDLAEHVPAPDSEVADLFEHCRTTLESQGYPCSKSDFGGASRRKNKFAYRCHKHVTSMVHIAQVWSPPPPHPTLLRSSPTLIPTHTQRANASSEELKSLRQLLRMVKTQACDLKDDDHEDDGDEAPAEAGASAVMGEE